MNWRLGLLRDLSASFFQPGKRRMTNTNYPNSKIQRLTTKLAFGHRVSIYTHRKANMLDESLELMDRMIAAAIGSNRPNWSIDLGTDTGFTAFTLGRISNSVIVSDTTEPILRQAKRLGQERKIANLHVSQNTTEALPFVDESIDLVSSKVSAHDFKSFKKALEETNRVLKHGGSLVMANAIAPEQDDIAHWMNTMKLRRDCSHTKNRKISTISKVLTEIGLRVIDHGCKRIYLRFNEWTSDTNVSSEEIESLRRAFLNAPNTIRETFQVAPVHGDITFSWPCWVFRAIKQ